MASRKQKKKRFVAAQQEAAKAEQVAGQTKADQAAEQAKAAQAAD
mgnify:CR=1 FL=1